MPIEAPMWIFGRYPHHGMRQLDALELERYGKHNANSHDEDKSKYLKYDAQ